jgi:GTP-binding protein EngB required for normal cell division
MMVWYLAESGIKNRLVLLIIDAVVGFTKDDREMLAILRDQKINYIVVANKIDKVRMGQEKSLGAFPYSSLKKTGRTELLKKIAEYLI